MTGPRPRSPFRPSFGASPPLVAGRDAIVAELGDALDAGPGAAGRAALVTGNRGIGKTVVLNEAEGGARERGWLVISETASRGVLDRLTDEALPELAALLRQGPRERRRVSGFSLPSGLGGIDFDLPQTPGVGGLRSQLNALTDVLDAHDTGLLITVDEVHAKVARDDVGALCAVVQHMFREERPVAFVAAGLPAAVQDLLTSDVSTFLRRARRFVLEPLSRLSVEEALRVPIRDGGRTIDDAELDAMVAAAQGYPYLVQVVGDLVWRQDPSAVHITSDHVRRGIEHARREAGFSLHEPALNDLSEVDRVFVRAMAEDDGDSSISDIEARMGREHGYVSRYRSRLIVAGIIEPSRRGHLRFTIPYLRDHLLSRPDF